MRGNFQRTNPPVNEGDEIEVRIEAVGEKGDGIAKVNNFVIFVPNTKEGDNVKIKITRVLRNMAFAEVIGEAQGQTAEPEAEEPIQEQDGSEPASEEADEPVSEQKEEEAQPEPETGDSEDFGEDEQ